MNSYLDALYSTDQYARNSNNWSSDEDKEKSRTLLRILRCAGLSDQITSILDVGCGTGGLLGAIVDDLPGVKRAKGIDLSEIAIDRAIRTHGRGIEFSVAQLDTDSDTYDLVVLSHVLEHVMDWDMFLANVSKASRSFVYINVPLDANLVSVVRGTSLRDTYKKYGHVHFFDESFIVNYLTDVGFSVLAKDYGEEFKFQSSTFRGRVARIPRILFGMFHKKLAARLVGGYSLALLLVPPGTNR